MHKSILEHVNSIFKTNVYFAVKHEYPARKRIILCLIAKDQKNFYALKDLYLRYVSILGLIVGSLVLSSLALECPTIALCLLYLRVKDDPIN